MRRSKFITGLRRGPRRIDRHGVSAGAGRRPLTAALLALLVVMPAVAARAAETAPRIAVVAFGLFGDQSVFESEARGAAQALTDRFGGRAVAVRANTGARSDATVEKLAAALDAAARDIDADNDVLALVLSSHGSRVGLAVRAEGHDDMLWPQILAAMLDHAGVRHRVVIISACYSGVFIPVLANPDTLVITAADADHPSFGCRDGAQWTYFGDAFFNTAMRHTSNLRDTFALARAIVRDREWRSGFDPSNPQMAGGENVVDRLQGRPDPDAASAEPSAPNAATMAADPGLRPWPVPDGRR